MKKKIMIGVSYAAVAALAVGGTVAYFTSTKDAVNVLTMGDGVAIELIEQQRSEDGSKLVDFEQGKELLPIVGSAQGVKDKWGMPADATNYVDKIVTVENTGRTDAYVRIIVGVPSDLEDSEVANGPLHWNLGNNFNGATSETYGKAISWELTEQTTIDNIEYNLYTFTYNDVLKAGETTEYAAFTGFYLNSAVDYDAEADCYTFNGQPIEYDLSEVIIPVQAQAVQATWDTAAEAFKESGLPSNPWTDGGISAKASDAAGLVEAAANGGSITVASDITVDDESAEAMNIITSDAYVNFGDSTLNLNLPNATGATANWVGLNVNGGSVALDGTDGGITTANNGELYAVVVRNGATLVINGGNYIGGTTAVQVSEGSLKITGGFFKAQTENQNFVINCKDAAYNNGTATVEITGGTFVNWNPADNAAETGGHTDFVPDGYTVKSEKQENGEVWYTVVEAE